MDTPTRYEQDAYGFCVAVEMELESVEEQQYRQRRIAKRKAKRIARRAAWASIDWRTVEPLPKAARWENEPGYRESLRPWEY